MSRNRRRGHHETIRTLRYGKGVRAWWRAYRTALSIMGVLFVCGALVGMFVGGWIVVTNPESWLSSTPPQGPPDAEHITLHQDPHVVTCFKAWTESPQGSCLVMVWSDGQVWRAYTDNPKSIRSWDLLAHVRAGETP